MSNKNYYDTLGVSKTATSDEIKKAFRKLAHEHHPDKKGGNEAKFKEINEAYQVLGNEEKRKQYDQFGQTFSNGAGGFNAGGFNGQGFNWQDFARQAGGQGNFGGQNFDFDLGDIFGDFFSARGGSAFGGGGRHKRGQQRSGEDIEVQINIGFREAVFGAEKIISLERQDVCEKCNGKGHEAGVKIITCPECKGVGQVRQEQRTIFGVFASVGVCPTCAGVGKKPEKFCSKCHGAGRTKNKKEIKIEIPAGIDEGQSIKISNAGNAGEKGSAAGDLYISFQIRPDKIFTREGENILTKIEINIAQAALGDKIEVETLDGIVEMKIPEGTQSGKIFILKDRGVPILNSHGRGDQLVEVVVKIPTKLSRKEKQLLEELKNEWR
ncbi:MAG: molecular chaperone DnaJ [Patescibacteria group bacterium]|nr:molecular chaperone DnaJ [Patescibacteria group bacterium]